jgi:formate--tetrahydrofolate ligase
LLREEIDMASEVKSDIEIARAARKLPIWEIGAKLRSRRNTSSPTATTRPRFRALHRVAGEPPGRQAGPGHRDQPDAGGRGQDHHDGRASGDGLNRIGKRAAVCLREPSLGRASA